MIKTIFLILTVVGGLAIFLSGLRKLKRQSFKESLIDIIISPFSGLFQFSGIGMVLIGLFLMVICILALMGK